MIEELTFNGHHNHSMRRNLIPIRKIGARMKKARSENDAVKIGEPVNIPTMGEGVSDSFSADLVDIVYYQKESVILMKKWSYIQCLTKRRKRL